MKASASAFPAKALRPVVSLHGGRIAAAGATVVAVLVLDVVDIREGASILWLRLALSLAAIVGTAWLALHDRNAEHGRELSEHRYRGLFNAAGVATWESDWSKVYQRLQAMTPEGEDPACFVAAHPELVQDIAKSAVILDCNEAAVSLFEARSREEMVGRNIALLYTDRTNSFLAQLFSELLHGRQERESEAEFFTFKGNVVEVLHRASLIPDGEPWSRVLIMALDVTERNRIRARLDEVSTELAHAARVSMLGQLAASIAHEVNQPLAAIVNWGRSGQRWLSRDPPEIGEAVNSLERVVANGVRAADTITRVRALARKTPTQVEPLDLGEMIAEAAALIEREARLAGAKVSWTQALHTPPAQGDRIQVQQVLVNLMMNGLQAMRETAGRPRELALSIAPDGAGQVEVRVHDSGPGIAEPNPDRIFEPFFTTKADGMGMGLSICRSIIEAQGGKIMAANNEDFGATVVFTLPAAALEAVV